MGSDGRGRLRRNAVKAIILFFFTVSVLILTLYYIVRQNPAWMQREPEAIVILDENSLWRYMEEGKDPSIGKVWTTLNYDASFWKAGYGSFGTEQYPDVSTLMQTSSGQLGDIHSYFFRYEFEVEPEQAAKMKSILGEIAYKDAAVVYLNGEIIFTGNIPPGGYETNLEAGASEERSGISTANFQVTDLSALREGKNVLSVEIHQRNEHASDIYFAFLSFALSEDNLQEPDYETRHLLLTKGRQDDSLFINYVSGRDEAYKVEYMEASHYNNNESAFARYGSEAYMGSRSVSGSYLNQVELTHLKENMDYVYRMIRVGGMEGSEVYRFSTGKNYRASFGVTATPVETGEWSGTLDYLQTVTEAADFLAVIGSGGTDGSPVDRNEQIMFSDSELWREEPGIFVGTDGEQNAPLLHSVFGTDNFYLTDRDITVIGIHDAVNEDTARYIRRIKNATRRAWTVVLTASSQPVEAFLDAGANVVLQRAGDGSLQISCKTDGTVHTYTAVYTTVFGYANQLELQCFDQDGSLMDSLLLK